MKEEPTFTHNNLKTRSRSHRTERDFSRKERGLSMLSKSKASPCILTLILSFILSDYLSKVLKDKLKPCKIKC